MSHASEMINKSRKIVVKVGTNTISGSDGRIDNQLVAQIADQIAEMMEKHIQIVIVSSGARISGLAAINGWARQDDMNYMQALCAIGQVELINQYKKSFGKYGLQVGQMLLTRYDFTDAKRNLNIRNTLFTLVDENIIPIINENDTVCVVEIEEEMKKIGDNDSLAAMVASLWNADLMIILSDIDGIYDKNPRKYGDAKLIEVVDDVPALKRSIDMGMAGDFGVGGIETKINAAETLLKYGIETILTNGKTSDILRDLSKGEGKSTVFVTKRKQVE